jgi:hypothetical protein
LAINPSAPLVVASVAALPQTNGDTNTMALTPKEAQELYTERTIATPEDVESYIDKVIREKYEPNKGGLLIPLYSIKTISKEVLENVGLIYQSKGWHFNIDRSSMNIFEVTLKPNAALSHG